MKIESDPVLKARVWIHGPPGPAEHRDFLLRIEPLERVDRGELLAALRGSPGVGHAATAFRHAA